VLDPTVIVLTGSVAYVVSELIIRNYAFKSPYIAAVLIGGVVAAFVFRWFGVYNESALFSKWPPIQRLLISWTITFCVLLFIAFTLKITGYYSRIWSISWFSGASFLLLTSRLILNDWIQRRVQDGALVERAVILGAGEEGQAFAAHLSKQDNPCTKVVGFVDDRKTRLPRSSHGFDVLGDVNHLMQMIRADMVDQVFVALPWNAKARLRELLDQLAVTPVQVFLVIEPLGLDYSGATFRFLGKVPTLQVFDRPLGAWSYILKAIEDRLLAGLILIFVAPLMLLVALAIRLDSPGPVLFRQKRHGFNHNSIEILKFRTMYVEDAEGGGTMRQATRDDPRVTRVGRFLRRSSLDELPQFLNVLAGDMSIVGPRPHAIAHTHNGQRFEEIVDRYAARHRVKPGITGWAQVNGWRGETDTIVKMKGRVEHDLYYIENWSIWFDIWIIARTIFVVLKDDSAY